MNGTLDYETQKSYQLVVRAFDGPGKYGDLTINIAVLDVNDVVPQFEKPVYDVSVNESVAIGESCCSEPLADHDKPAVCTTHPYLSGPFGTQEYQIPVYKQAKPEQR